MLKVTITTKSDNYALDSEMRLMI